MIYNFIHRFKKKTNRIKIGLHLKEIGLQIILIIVCVGFFVSSQTVFLFINQNENDLIYIEHKTKGLL